MQSCTNCKYQKLYNGDLAFWCEAKQFQIPVISLEVKADCTYTCIDNFVENSCNSYESVI